MISITTLRGCYCTVLLTVYKQGFGSTGGEGERKGLQGGGGECEGSYKTPVGSVVLQAIPQVQSDSDGLLIRYSVDSFFAEGMCRTQ